MLDLKPKILQRNNASAADFWNFLETMKEQLKRKLDLETNQLQVNLLHDRALRGDPEAISYFMTEIEQFLRGNPFSGSFPSAYSSLVEALYHEWIGFGPAFKWLTDPAYMMSTGLQIIGKNMFYAMRGQYHPYPWSFISLDRTYQLLRALLKHDPTVRLDRDKPAAEFKIDDPLWPGRFIRLAVWDAPRVWDGFTAITFRRQVVDYLSLDEQAGTGSIPFEAVSMLRNLFRTFRNIVVAGPVGSGKTTFANTVVGEQIVGAKNTLGVVMIEKHPESILPHIFPNHRIIPVKGEKEELMEIGIESLRMDPNIIYMTEMRYDEWEFYLFAGEKGFDGITGTFHTVDAEDVPYQAAMAVFTKRGGQLAGYLIQALKSCEIVIVMESMPDGQKKVTRISEIVYDAAQQTVAAHDIMRYDRQSKQWAYDDAISEGMRSKMFRKDPAAAEAFLSEIKRLAAASRISSPRVESRQSKRVLGGI